MDGVNDPFECIMNMGVARENEILQRNSSMPFLQRILVENYRCLRHIDYAPNNMNVFFGPNGVGKTTFLDALWFIQNAAIIGSEDAASNRHHGIGALADNSGDDEQIRIQVETDSAIYQITFGYSQGRIEPFAGEKLYSKSRKLQLFQRSVGSVQARFYDEQTAQETQIKLRDPEQLALTNYLMFTDTGPEADEIRILLKSLHFYSSRMVRVDQLRRFGSDSSVHTFLYDRWQNLWSALRNLHDIQRNDERFDSIIAFMRKAFPNSFKDLIFEQIGADRVGAQFIEIGRQRPVQISGVSDGHLQMLGLLTSLFGNARDQSSLLLFDEPETSLHPHAIACFAEAATEAVHNWNRQIFIATHSPVLISQFEPSEVVVVEREEDHSTAFRQVAEIKELQEVIQHYALGALYMAEEIGKQSEELIELNGRTSE